MGRKKQWPQETTPSSTKRALLLLRVSDPKQLRKDVSIPAQRAAGQAKAKELGAVIADEYIEPGYSGRDIEKRPIFRKMIGRIKAERDVDYVIVYAFSRFARNVYDHSVMKTTLERLGVKVVSCTENIQGDKPSDRAMENMIAVFNEFRSLVDGEDIKYKMNEKAKSGGTTYCAPIGYLNARKKTEHGDTSIITLDPERAPLVKLAFELYATGRYTLDSLEEKMEELGLRTRGNRRYSSRPVSRSKLGVMLRDRYYIGYVRWRSVDYRGTHEPLISVDLFERVQRVMDSQAGAGIRRRQHHHYLKGLLWCQRCQRRFVLIPGRGNGGEYFYFFCRGRQDHECDMPYLRVERIEQAVLEHYATVVFSEEFRAEVAAKLDEEMAADLANTAKARKALATRLVELERKEDEYFSLVGNPAWPREKLTAKMTEVQEERDRVAADLAKLEGEVQVARDIFLSALELLRRPQELYARLEPPERRLLTQLLFVRLKLDETGVVDEELNEPFEAIVPIGRVYEAERRRVEGDDEAGVDDGPRNGGEKQQAEPDLVRTLPALRCAETANGVSWTEDAVVVAGGTPDRGTHSALLGVGAPRGEHGSNKALMVREGGFEPPRP
ncbi:MAG: recombinase family protein [Mycobacteriales bacterium]